LQDKCADSHDDRMYARRHILGWKLTGYRQSPLITHSDVPLIRLIAKSRLAALQAENQPSLRLEVVL